MSKVRIYELAKETGLPNQEVIRRLSELGIDVGMNPSETAQLMIQRLR